MYLRVTVTFTSAVRVLFRSFAVHMYCPEYSAVMLGMTSVPAVPASLCRSVPVSSFRISFKPSLAHVIAYGGKLATLQVRFRLSPSFTVVIPEISGFLTSLRQKKKN